MFLSFTGSHVQAELQQQLISELQSLLCKRAAVLVRVRVLSSRCRFSVLSSVSSGLTIKMLEKLNLIELFVTVCSSVSQSVEKGRKNKGIQQIL